MPCSIGDSSTKGRSTNGANFSRSAGASFIEPCNKVLNQASSASSNSSSSCKCASISPASCKLSVPLTNQAYKPCNASSRARLRALRTGCTPAELASCVGLFKIFALFVFVSFGFKRCDQVSHLNGTLGAIATFVCSAGLSLLVVLGR